MSRYNGSSGAKSAPQRGSGTLLGEALGAARSLVRATYRSIATKTTPFRKTKTKRGASDGANKYCDRVLAQGANKAPAQDKNRKRKQNKKNPKQNKTKETYAKRSIKCHAPFVHASACNNKQAAATTTVGTYTFAYG